MAESNGASSNQVHNLPVPKADPHGAEGHGHDSHGPDHVPHVLPLWIYMATWITLLVLTVVTVAASYLDLGSANILIALLIATIKASVVAMMFMHLRWDHKFHAIVFSFSIIFLTIFIAFTMYDTETRGRTDAQQADRPADVGNPFKEGQAMERLRKLHPTDVPAPTEPPR